MENKRLELCRHRLDRTAWVYLALWAVCLWPVFDLANRNFLELQRASFAALWQPAGLYAAVAVVAHVLAWIGARAIGRGRAVSLAVLCIGLSMIGFAPLFDELANALTAAGYTSGADISFVAIATVLVAAVWWLARFPSFNRMVALAAVFAAAIPLAGLVMQFAQSGSAIEVTAQPEPGATAGRRAGPNVYYVILDEYVGEENLEAVTGIDLRSFIEAMQSHGFKYLLAARSNYHGTAQSVGSLFHMAYLGDPTAPGDYYPAVLNRASPPAFLDYFVRAGYRPILSMGWLQECDHKHFSCAPNAKQRLNRESLLLLSRTPVRIVAPGLFRRKVDSLTPITAEFLAEQIQAGPLFLFAHHMQPHSPWYFDRECGQLGADMTDRQKYGEAVLCVNKTVLRFVAKVSRLDPEALIVIQSDHGSRFRATEEADAAGRQFGWQNFYAASDAAVSERYEIVNFVKAPSRCADDLRPDLGPTNTARFVVACLAGQIPSYLDERTFVPGPDYLETNRVMAYD